MVAVQESHTYTALIGTHRVELPVIPISPAQSIALFMTIDHGVRLIEELGRELADRFAGDDVEVVATAATLGIPLAIEVTKALGLDDYLVLQKSPKVHLGSALRAETTSITSSGHHALLLDRARIKAVAGRRTLFVDDVVSTGSSALAAIALLRRAKANVVAAGFLLQEESAGRDLVEAADVPVQTLGTIPVLDGSAEDYAAFAQAPHDAL